jgi:hypothetical protein
VAPAVAPFNPEDHQVQRVHRLDLDPAGATPAGLVARIERFDHDPLVAAGERLAQEVVRLRDV